MRSEFGAGVGPRSRSLATRLGVETVWTPRRLVGLGRWVPTDQGVVDSTPISNPVGQVESPGQLTSIRAQLACSSAEKADFHALPPHRNSPLSTEVLYHASSVQSTLQLPQPLI